ncbi:MAG: hypothetical protein AAGG75_27455 [Bacteroidota bacterium]
MSCLSFGISTPSATFHHQMDTYAFAFASPQGFIVMEDEVMLRVDTETPEDPVSTIQVFSASDELLLELSTCHTQQCTVDLSVLAVGSYKVVVKTSTNRAFSSFVQIS